MNQNATNDGWRGMIVIACVGAAMALAAGCGRTEHRGPLAQAGHDVDHAAQHARHDVNHAAHNATH